MTSQALVAGFKDPVLHSQTAFRALMNALAHPGTPSALFLPDEAPEPLTPGLAAVALTLLDHDTPVWLSSSLAAAPAVTRFLAFHTGAPLVVEPDEAAFAFAANWDEVPSLSSFAQGTPTYPDRSTTLIVASPAFAGESGLRLSGPGIRGRRDLPGGVVPHKRLGEFAVNRAAFPLGVDVFVVAPNQVLGLPRTILVEA